MSNVCFCEIYIYILYIYQEHPAHYYPGSPATPRQDPPALQGTPLGRWRLRPSSRSDGPSTQTDERTSGAESDLGFSQEDGGTDPFLLSLRADLFGYSTHSWLLIFRPLDGLYYCIPGLREGARFICPRLLINETPGESHVRVQVPGLLSASAPNPCFRGLARDPARAGNSNQITYTRRRTPTWSRTRPISIPFSSAILGHFCLNVLTNTAAARSPSLL